MVLHFFNSRNIMWFYYYDDDITDIEELKKEPNKLREKPSSIIRLEKINGVTAERKINGFGGW